MEDIRFREPYEQIVAKLELAELTIQLGDATRAKWERMDTMKDVLKREEDLIKQIAIKTQELRKLMVK